MKKTTIPTRILTAAFTVVLVSIPVWAQATAEPAKTPVVIEEPPLAPPDPKNPPGTIAGSVRSAGGFPGGTIIFTNKATGETKTVPAAPMMGDYKIEGLAEGTYLVTVDTPGFTPASAEVEPGGKALDFSVRQLMAWEPLLPVFSWLFRTPLGVAVRDSTWAVAYLEVFHLLGLTVLLGSSVAVGLRVSNIAMRSLPASEVAKEVRPYMWGGLLLVVLTGIPILASEAEKMFQSRPFELKMFFFVLSNIFQFGVVAWMTRAKQEPHPVFGKLAALLSVVFWYVVAWEGRAIAFF